jgi:uncharacterized protein DUF3617
VLRFFTGSMLALAALASQAQQMEPGEWEFTNTMRSPMLPQPQTMTMKRCISSKEASDPTGWQPRPESGCKVTPKDRSGDSFSWDISCPKSGMNGSGTARLGGGTLEGETKMTMSGQGQTLEMTTKTKGRRVGPCKQTKDKKRGD